MGPTMPKVWFALLLGIWGGCSRGVCSPQQPPELLRSYDSRKNSAREEALRLLREFESEAQAARLMREEVKPPIPSVLVGATDACSARGLHGGESETSIAPGLRLPLTVFQSTNSLTRVNIDETGRPWAPCPKAICNGTPYYGNKGSPVGSPKIMKSEVSTLGSLKQMTDFTFLGLDPTFNQKAYEGFQICKDFFFFSSSSGRSSSDPACVIAHLDESSASIRALETANLKVLHPKLKAALVMASMLSLTQQKKVWTRKLLFSPSVRLAWHVVEAFSEMNVSMLEANVGEALNEIVLKDMTLLKPLEDLIRFATTCITYEEYPEKSCQEPKRYPSPGSPKYKDYPIYDYLRAVGAEVSFPKALPSDWQPRVYDGNRRTPRAHGDREGFNFHGNWKKEVYNSWHNLWVLSLIVYDAGSMWQWTQHLNANTFFFKPWKVTRVGTLKVAEAGPLRYDDLSSRFRVDPSSPPTETEYASCPFHLTDLGFFAKVNAPDGRVTAQWHHQDRWKPAEMSGENSTQCPLSQAAVPCPPKVNPDKCGIDASYVRPVESPWLYRLEREESWVTWETDNERSDYVDRIWSARGTAFPKLWLLNNMCEGVACTELSSSERAKLHSGFLFLFQKGAKHMIAEDIKEVTQKIEETGRRHVVLFTGHSLGGAVAQIAAWYYASKSQDLVRRGLLQIRCVTFGAPAWGNEDAYQEFMSSGVVIHDVATNMDPVTTLHGEPALGHGLQWRKPFHYRIMLEDLAKVVVASGNPLEPDFFGQLWTRKELHAGNFLKRTFGALANMQNVDSIFVNPLLTHFLSYSAVLTIMADLVPEAGPGSGLAAPLLNDPPIIYAAHSVNTALIEAQPRMKSVMHRIALESGARILFQVAVDNVAEEGAAQVQNDLWDQPAQTMI